MEEENYVKEYLKANFEIVVQMLNVLDYEDEQGLFGDHVLREFVINCIGAVFQYDEGLVSEEIQGYLNRISGVIGSKITGLKEADGDEDTVQLLETENEKITKIIEKEGDFLLIH